MSDKNTAMTLVMLAGGGALVCTLLLLLTPSSKERKMRDTPRHSKSLDSLHPDFKPKVQRVVRRLIAKGHRPGVGVAWRNEAWQRKAVEDGRSRILYSLHTVSTPSGDPAALAVDLVDVRYGWPQGTPDSNPEVWRKAADFFKDLGDAARAEGLAWGGNYSQSNKHWARYGMGWDPAHVSAFRETQSKLQALKRGDFAAAGVRDPERALA